MKRNVQDRGAEGTSQRREERKERRSLKRRRRASSRPSKKRRSSQEAKAKGCVVELVVAEEDQGAVRKKVRKPRPAGKGTRRKDLIHLLTKSQVMGLKVKSKATEMQSLPGPRLETNFRMGKDLRETTIRLRDRKERKVSKGKRGDHTAAEEVEEVVEAVEEAAEVATARPPAKAPTLQ